MSHEFDCPECSHETTYRTRVGGVLGVFFHFYRTHGELMTDSANPRLSKSAPKFGYEPVEAPRDFIAELFDEETQYDNILFEVETDTTTYSVEAMNFRERYTPPLTGFNVAEIDDQHDAERILADVDLDVVDTDLFRYAVFECDATGTDEMTAAFETVLDGLGDSAQTVRAKRRQIENLGPALGWIRDKATFR